MTDTPLPFPRRGLNDNWAFGQQPGETTRDAQNVRSVDPTNGRTRGAQRSGMVKHKAQLVGSARPVRLIRSAIHDSKTITYEALEGDLDAGSFSLNEEEWAKTTETQLGVTNTAVDLSGNLYALTGKAVEKRNPDGVLLWAFTIPVENSAFTIGPLVVDTDLSVYVGVDGGSPLSTGAGIFKIDQVPIANTADTEPALGWLGKGIVFDRWVRELRLHQGTLRCLLQDDAAYRSHVLTVTNIALEIPAEQGQIEVPYPSTCMVVKDDGSAVTGHPPFVGRDSSPKHPGVGISLEEWTSGDLDDYENRVWSSYRAADLSDNNVGDGDAVSFWPDRTGKGRNLTTGVFPSNTTGPGAPTLRHDGSTGLPSVYFDGTQGLFSAAGGGTDAQREACKTMVPNSGDGAYCIMVVCRPSSQKTPAEKDESGASIDAARWLFQQFTHTKFQGDSTDFDQNYTEAHRSGVVINTAPPTATGAYHYSWSGEFNGKGNKLGVTHSPGDLHAFTPSSGYKTTVSTVDGLGADPDADLMPTHRGAGWAGWPNEGQFDDPDSTEPGEGLCVITFMNCGGLDEAFAATGTYDVGATFTAAAGTFDRYPVGATGTIWAGGVSDTVTVASSTVLTLGTGNIGSASDVASHVVWERNWMSRSLLRINGQPIDRWEALPMSYAGADVGAGPPAFDRVLNLNVEHNPTGLGYPIDKSTSLLGFLGEIMEIEVFGRRQKNADRVDLGGTEHVLYPAVLTHPLYAAYGHSADTEGDDFGSHDKEWYNVNTNLLSSEMEKLEGEKMHRHGIAPRFQPSPTTATASDSALDANDTATVTTSFATGGRAQVELVVSDSSGAHTTHEITVQSSPDDATWTDTDIVEAQLGTSVGTVIARYIRAKVTTAEGGASAVDVSLKASGYPHPHYPATGAALTTYDIPILSNVADTGQAWVPRKRSEEAMIAKHDQAGKMIWCLVADVGTGFGDIFTEDVNGNVGATPGVTDAEPTAGLALTSTGDIYVAGPGARLQPFANSEHFALGIIFDTPLTESDPSLTSVGFWRLAGSEPDQEFRLGFAADQIIRLAVDEYDNLYVPVPPGTQFDAADAKDAIRIFGRDVVTDPMVSLNRLTTLGGTTKYQNGNSVSLPPTNPAYDTGDFAVNGIERSEFVYLGLEEFDNDAPDKVEALAKWRITSATTKADSQGRERDLVALSGGVVHVHNGATWDPFDDADDPALSADAHYFWSFQYRQKVYIGDGLSQVVYDPKLATLTKWESGTSGTLPEKCALGVVYHARVVLARAEGAPQNWFMSAAGDPDNWDFFPPTQSATQAVFGNNTAAEQCPDIINTLVPFKDDYLIFGCDHSIWLLRGDPVDNGKFDEVSSTIGMAFGKPWAKDPTGLLYFFGSKGGVYRMAGDSAPQHLSDARDGQDTSIQDRLRDIDLAAFRIQLEWDFERQGLIVLQIPYSETITTASKAWFWDVKNNAWWEDLPGAVTLQPYSSFVLDGDAADDRRVVYGCEDGFVRELSSTALDDDGTAIDSFVTIGPIAAGNDAEIVLNRLRGIFAREQDGCFYTVFASDTPSTLGVVISSGQFVPGLSPRLSVNRRGSFIWVQLRNNLASQRWAVEELQADVVKGGLRRSRA